MNCLYPCEFMAHEKVMSLEKKKSIFTSFLDDQWIITSGWFDT
jgi:hypothetical protein